jgi:hypothetical protein
VTSIITRRAAGDLTEAVGQCRQLSGGQHADQQARTAAT